MLSWLFYGFAPITGGFYGSTVFPLREPTEKDRYTEARLHSLELACAGLWELLKANNGYTDDQLMDMIKRVDQKRGSAAPVAGNQESVCPKCRHKMLTQNHAKCLWCGADLGGTPFQG